MPLLRRIWAFITLSWMRRNYDEQLDEVCTDEYRQAFPPHLNQ